MTVNLWDVPKLPQQGDPEKALTYESVGMALSNWEAFEGSLRMLFATFLRADVDIAAKRAFGALATFRARVDLIEAAAEAYFAIYPARRIKADYRSLMNRALKYGARRNEIAHGRVIEFKSKARKRDGWALYPSSYSTNKNLLVGTRLKALSVVRHRRAVLVPKYVYTSKEINALGKAFSDLTWETYALLDRVGQLWLHPLVRRALRRPETLSEQDWAKFEIRPPGLQPRQRPPRG